MKSFFRFMRGNILVLTVTDIISSFAMRMTFPFFPLFVLALSGTATAIGFISVFGVLASLLTYPIAGHIADSKGRIKVIGITRILSALAYLFYILAPNWLALAAGSFFMGLLIFHFPAESAITADSLPLKQRAVGFATLMAIPGAVAIVGPYTGAYIISKYGVDLGTRYLYAILMMCDLTVAIVRLRFLEDPPFARLQKPESRIRLQNVPLLIKRGYLGAWETLKWMPQSLKALTLVMVTSLFFDCVAAPFWVVYGVDIIRLTEIELGLIMLLAGGLRVGLSIPIGIIVDRFGERKAMISALALSVFPVFFFVYCTTFLQVLIVFLVISVANAFLMPACFALLTDIVPREKRGRVMAALGRGRLVIKRRRTHGVGPGIGLLLTIPIMLGSLVSGYIYSFNPAHPWIILSSALMLCLILTIIFVKEVEEPEG